MHGMRIYDQTKRGIYLRPAARSELREQELAQRLQVSKSPVREALQHLYPRWARRGMPAKGYRVSPISMTDARDMFAFRCTLEVACIQDSVKNASDEQLKALDQFREFDGDYENEFIVYNRDFHCALARCSSNGRMSRTTCDLIDETDRLTRMSVASMRGRNPHKFVEEHVAIISALQERNPRVATNLLKAHVSAAVKRSAPRLSERH